MEIADVKTYVVTNPVPYKGGGHWVFLKLVTDSGIEGFGEAEIEELRANGVVG